VVLDVVFGVVKMVNRMVERGQETTIKFAGAWANGLTPIYTDDTDSKQATATAKYRGLSAA
jgi:hypothetical protein